MRLLHPNTFFSSSWPVTRFCANIFIPGLRTKIAVIVCKAADHVLALRQARTIKKYSPTVRRKTSRIQEKDSSDQRSRHHAADRGYKDHRSYSPEELGLCCHLANHLYVWIMLFFMTSSADLA
jgi:hypothetical protein